jgi:spore coat protein CotH
VISGRRPDTGIEVVGIAPIPGGVHAGPPPAERLEHLGDAARDPAQAAFLYDEGTVHDLTLLVDRGAMNALDSDATSEVEGVLGYGGESWSVGVRLKGNMTLRGFTGKPSLKIDMHAWNPNQRFYGLKRLTLNNMVQDKSMLKEHLAYYLYRSLGVPAPRHGYVRLWVNGEWYGLFGLVESMDEQFIDQWWRHDDDGNLYEGGYGADVKDGQAATFAVQEAGEPANFADMQSLIDAYDDTTPDTYLDMLAEHFDLDALLSAFAIDLVAGNWDGYTRGANNFLLYHAPEADRWSLVPWGQDQAFTDLNVDIRNGWRGRLMTGCGHAPECYAALKDKVEVVLDAWQSLDLPGYATATAETIGPDCETDPRVEIPCSPKDVFRFLQDRPAKVRAELDQAP